MNTISHVSAYTYILKYNLLSLYNVNPMQIFRADHLVVDNQSVCSSLDRTISHTLSTLYLPVDLFV